MCSVSIQFYVETVWRERKISHRKRRPTAKHSTRREPSLKDGGWLASFWPVLCCGSALAMTNLSFSPHSLYIKLDRDTADQFFGDYRNISPISCIFLPLR
ncbi:hypothetical protein DdX_15001 [Ditylenchus destructor]|uniref:Uncharacterized protein n=1 Tax=Ditylenchus destructor TaxID=166010 RepID=A0AAD4MQ68_9BILA|nr:hypothetical protein DdX_15001 [Ditylenchus destructor]